MINISKSVGLMLWFGLALMNQSANAHHSHTATYDVEKSIEIEGVVKQYKFRNPHVRMLLDVVNEDGTTTEWVAETVSPIVLRRQGWTNDSFKVGDFVQIEGEPTHDGSAMVSMQTTKIIDPETQQVSSTFISSRALHDQPIPFAPTELPLTMEDGRPNLAGLWTGQGSPYDSPRDPDVPFNQTGRALQDAYLPSNDPQIYCDPPGLIRQAGMSQYGVRITQLVDRVIFDYEEYGGRREIFFDDRDAKGVATHFGDAIARYENDALIIEINNLLPNVATPEGNRLSDQATIVQTYMRVDEPNYGAMLSVETATSDPAHLADTFVMTNIKVAIPDREFIENECVAPRRERQEVHPYMSFFLTSSGSEDGANLGGLSGADSHCKALASTVNQGHKTWRAYLSTTGDEGVNARDRIGSGPWYNASGELIAIDVDQLHSENWLTKATVKDERGRVLNEVESTAQDDGINSRHDILTGSLLDGTASDGEADTTCNNWTSNSEGSALIGHSDRRGGGINPTSWNYAHPTRGCSPHLLATSDGAGLFYCFANEE